MEIVISKHIVSDLFISNSFILFTIQPSLTKTTSQKEYIVQSSTKERFVAAVRIKSQKVPVLVNTSVSFDIMNLKTFKL